MDYLPNSKEVQNEMLKEAGFPDFPSLFRDIPEGIQHKGSLPIPKGLSEPEVDRLLKGLAGKNKIPETSFLGAGCYKHYIPAAVPALVSRAEFYTAYTPYQPEISQGLLQGIFEFQTMVSRLTGTDAANASLYDGATALAEAAVMAGQITRKEKLLVSEGVHPEYREVLKTYAAIRDLKIEIIPMDEGVTPLSTIREKLDDNTAALMVQSPNFFGQIEDLAAMGDLMEDSKALFVPCFTEALSLALIRSPGSCKADIVVGEGQSLGIAAAYGGPHVGVMACKKKYLRKLPGRIVGTAKDSQGREGYVLTLQAREQHIRREKASSNICSNQALCALTVTVYMAALGRTGLKSMAEVNYARAQYAAKQFGNIPGIELAFKGPFFNEFVLKTNNAAEVKKTLKAAGITAGLELEKYYPQMKDCLLFCVTEMITAEEIDRAVGLLGPEKPEVKLEKTR